MSTAATALIAEDEAPLRAELRSMLAELWPELRIDAECADGLAALKALALHRPSVALLDIRMPGVGGLEVASAAAGVQVIFITAYDEYAVQAFEQGAVDYLLKPVKRERLAAALVRVRERLRLGQVSDWSQIVESLRQQLVKQGGAIQWITASAGSTTKIFAIDAVLYFQAEEKYTRVVTAADSAVIRTTLKELLQGLNSDSYWQVHRGVIVRVDAIHSVQRGADGKLVLRVKGRDELLPVSSAFQHRFKAM
jgi:DNA-binding LytR/AlgR family response regulator